MEIQDIDHVDGENNTGGLQIELKYAKLSDIQTLPVPVKTDPTGTGTFDQLATISADVIFKPGKTYKTITVTLETGKIDSELQGEVDGKSFMNKLSFTIPGSKAKTLGFASFAKNSSFIFWPTEVDGNIRQLGTEGYPAKMESAPITTGAKTADFKAGVFTFISAGNAPSPIFTGRFKHDDDGSGSGSVIE